MTLLFIICDKLIIGACRSKINHNITNETNQHKEVREIAIQEVKKQIEDKIQLTVKVDSTIEAVCEKIKKDDVVIGEYANTIQALAMLVMARALL